MVETNPELRLAIDAAKERIKVETYAPKAMKAGLQGNAQGFWSGTLMGGATGALGGGLISLGLMAASATSAFIGWPLVLGVAGIGATMGGATGARVGAGSGAVAGVAAERERRDKAEQLEQEILGSLDKQRKAIEEYRKNPVVEKNDTVGEVFATSRSTGEAIGKMVNWKTMLICITICSLVGMGLFGATFMLAPAAGTISSGLGSLGMTSMASALGIGAGAGAAMGVSYGIAYPPIFSGLSKGVADLLGNKMVEGKSGFAPVISAEQMQANAQKAYGAFENSANSTVLAAPSNKTQPSSHVTTITDFGELTNAARQSQI